MTSVPPEERSSAGQAVPAGTALRVGHVYLNVRRGRLHYLNPVARQLHTEGVPFTSTDLRGQRLYTAGGEAATAADLPLLVAWRQRQPVEVSFVLPREGGTVWRLSWTASPMSDKRGRTIGVLGSVACQPLEPDWEVLAELAHDLRTPLQSVQLLCAILDQLPLVHPQVRQTLDTLHTASERAMEIALELLEHCRGPVQDRSRKGPSWFGLEPFLVRLAREHAETARRRGLVLATEFAAVRGWEAHMDRVRLSRILSNLLVNAIRYTSCGRVALHASWREQSGGKFLALNVVDTGPGLSPEEQESIFQPFTRGRAGKEGDSGGSGLGLAVVDRLVEELGLTLTVSSEYGRGSDFQLLLPAAMLRPIPMERGRPPYGGEE